MTWYGGLKMTPRISLIVKLKFRETKNHDITIIKPSNWPNYVSKFLDQVKPLK